MFSGKTTERHKKNFSSVLFMKRKCIICKQWFDHEKPNRRHCTRVRCRIKLSYIILRQKGYDPEMYYQKMILEGHQVKCKLCSIEMKARFIRDFFYPICKKCEDGEKEVFWPCVDEFNKDAIEEACGFALPQYFLETIKNTWDDSKGLDVE